MNLKPPEWVARVGASIEEAAGLSASAQQVLRRQALGLRNVTDLDTKKNMIRNPSEKKQ